MFGFSGSEIGWNPLAVDRDRLWQIAANCNSSQFCCIRLLSITDDSSAKIIFTTS